MIPKRVFPGTQILHFLPAVHALLSARAAPQFFVQDLPEIYVRLWRVGDHHLVGIGRVFEEVVNTFLFHQPRGEVEVALPVLDAVVSRLVSAL